MATIFEVADWFLSKKPMTPKKVQKLCYYYKAWGLALYNQDLLPESEFEAWIHGPVNPALYQKYINYVWQDIPQTKKDNSKFTDKEVDLLESVWLTYGGMSANALEVQTHIEIPWRNARVGLSEFEKSHNLISNDDMKKYYRSIYIKSQGE